MELKDIRTKNNLVDYIQTTIPKDKLTAESPEAQANWFVSWAQATLMFDSYNTKDLAHALLDGIAPISGNMYAIPDFLETFFVEADEEDNPEMKQDYINEAVGQLQSLLNQHFGL